MESTANHLDKSDGPRGIVSPLPTLPHKGGGKCTSSSDESYRTPIKDPQLIPLWHEVQAGGRLSADMGRILFRTPDLLGLGWMADQIKRKRWGERVTFVMNRQVNPSNICVLTCRFCDFAKKAGDRGAYSLSVDEILNRLNPELKEVHITGSLHPHWAFKEAVELVKAIRSRYPLIHIKAFTAVEIDYMARVDKKSSTDVLKELKEAGLQCLPGGGAEIFSERVHRELFPQKIGADRWLEIHREAHLLGIQSNATLLYGHIETMEERLEHLLRLRALQDETGGFMSFIPLAYQLGESKVVDHPVTVFDTLRLIAASRLLLDNIPHLKAYWVTAGEDVTALALHFGADDIDGTIQEECIMHAAKAETPKMMGPDHLTRLIADAGFVPRERDGLYQMVNEPTASQFEAGGAR